MSHATRSRPSIQLDVTSLSSDSLSELGFNVQRFDAVGGAPVVDVPHELAPSCQAAGSERTAPFPQVNRHSRARAIPHAAGSHPCTIIEVITIERRHRRKDATHDGCDPPIDAPEAFLAGHAVSRTRRCFMAGLCHHDGRDIRPVQVDGIVPRHPRDVRRH
jgi:hypothetical protein